MIMIQRLIRKSSICLLASISLVVLSSCVDPKEVLYIQDIPDHAQETIRRNYEPKIQKDDQLYISVSSKQPELTKPFIVSEMGGVAGDRNNNQNKYRGYLVDSNGNIVLPVIGKVKASGKTCTALASDISSALRESDYIKDASVNVQIMNFKISVLGEVAKPGVYEIQTQRVTIMEAISRAGDLTIDGNRDITVIREQNGRREVAKVDLRSKDIFSSPYYYLHQNDILVVAPSERKVNTRSDTAQYYGWGLSGLGLTIAVIALCL